MGSKGTKYLIVVPSGFTYPGLGSERSLRCATSTKRVKHGVQSAWQIR